jgi:iron complex transport system ATP-binding protein
VSELSFRHASVAYGRGRARRTALSDLSLTVASGTWTCIIGPNGAGKSSALRAVCGLVAHSGEILVDGAPLPGHAAARARLVALVPQSPMIADSMSAFDYVLLGRTPHLGHFSNESATDRDIVDRTLDCLDMSDFADRPMGELSGGERQRLVIARAIAQQANILLLDEPTSALDIGHQQQALELVKRMSAGRGLTVLSVTHDLTLAGMYADQLVLLRDGTVRAAGAPAEVLTERVLDDAYGTPVRVLPQPDGSIIVAPTRANSLR